MQMYFLDEYKVTPLSTAAGATSNRKLELFLFVLSVSKLIGLSLFEIVSYLKKAPGITKKSYRRCTHPGQKKKRELDKIIKPVTEKKSQCKYNLMRYH